MDGGLLKVYLLYAEDYLPLSSTMKPNINLILLYHFPPHIQKIQHYRCVEQNKYRNTIYEDREGWKEYTNLHEGMKTVMIKKTTQVDKYLSKHRTRRIYTRTVLVTITQNVPDKRTRRSKNHLVALSHQHHRPK